jgi:Ca2+-binding EF-hand superfamily protein
MPYRWLILAAVLASSLAPGVAEAQGPDWRERFRAHDHNGDGRIDRAEFQEWMVDVFYQRDQGRKGYLTVDDVRGAMTPEVFKAINRKHDGKLALAEFLNAMFQDFQAIDTGQAGSITIEQIDAYVRRSPR